MEDLVNLSADVSVTEISVSVTEIMSTKKVMC